VKQPGGIKEERGTVVSGSVYFFAVPPWSVPPPLPSHALVSFSIQLVNELTRLFLGIRDERFNKMENSLFILVKNVSYKILKSVCIKNFTFYLAL
jgi:hypothetical protein